MSAIRDGSGFAAPHGTSLLKVTSTPERTGATGSRARGYPLAGAAAREYWHASGLDQELRALDARISGYRSQRRVDTVRLQAELNTTLFELEDAEGRLRACLRELRDRNGRSADAHSAALRRLDAVCRLTALLVDEPRESDSEDVVLGQVAQLLAGEFGARVTVFLARSASPPVRVAACASGADPDGADPPAPSDAAVRAGRRVQEEGRPLLRAGEAEAAGALLAVPLTAGGRVLGSLVLVREERFAVHELGLLEELGRQLALALRAGRVHDRVATTARTLQSSLMPAELPLVPGVQVAAVHHTPGDGSTVGGDFYDVFPVKDGWGLLLGDVCGKGEEAAAVTAAVRHSTRALSVWDPCPDVVLEKVGHTMTVQNTTDRFATAVFAHLRAEPGSGPGATRVRVASAGHLPGAVVRARGNVSFLKGGGCPLGIEGLSEVSLEELLLEPGDALLLYSDGATEARDPDGVFFDERGLAAVLAETEGLSAEALVRAVEQRVLGFAGGSPQDDMALLAIRVVPP